MTTRAEAISELKEVLEANGIKFAPSMPSPIRPPQTFLTFGNMLYEQRDTFGSLGIANYVLVVAVPNATETAKEQESLFDLVEEILPLIESVSAPVWWDSVSEPHYIEQGTSVVLCAKINLKIRTESRN